MPDLQEYLMADFDLQPNFADDTAWLVEWIPSRVLQFKTPGSRSAVLDAVAPA